MKTHGFGVPINARVWHSIWWAAHEFGIRYVGGNTQNGKGPVFCIEGFYCGSMEFSGLGGVELTYLGSETSKLRNEACDVGDRV